MRQPRRGITNAIKAMAPRIVPPMTAPVSVEGVASPVTIRIIKVSGIECSLVSVW